MKSTRRHDDTAKRIAKKYSGQYNPGEDADVPLPEMTIEVETEDTIDDAPRQLQYSSDENRSQRVFDEGDPSEV